MGEKKFRKIAKNAGKSRREGGNRNNVRVKYFAYFAGVGECMQLYANLFACQCMGVLCAAVFVAITPCMAL